MKKNWRNPMKKEKKTKIIAIFIVLLFFGTALSVAVLAAFSA